MIILRSSKTLFNANLPTLASFKLKKRGGGRGVGGKVQWEAGSPLNKQIEKFWIST